MEFEQEDIAFIGLGILGGFISLFVMKSMNLNGFWKFATFVCTVGASFFVSKFIASR